MKRIVGASYLGSLSAVGVATCCVMPVTMMMLGLGGSWLAVFGKIAAASFYVLGISTLILLLAWLFSYQRRSISHLKWWLAGSTALTSVAWVIVLNETRINDFLITLM